jgi:phage terminase large subunit
MPILTRPSIDFKNPNYDKIFRARLDMLERIRADRKATPSIVADLQDVYREYPAQMIIDWGVTVDPRNVNLGRPAMFPFILFDRQIELVDYAMSKWRKQENGLIEKSRDTGISWLLMSLGCCLATLFDDFSMGTGSRKWELVDDLGNLDTLLQKARVFLRYLPIEFRGGYNEDKHSKEGQILIPNTRSVIDGEAGDDIGRGGRKSMYVVDEAAHLERPAATDASLANNTNCKIELSSVKGMDNPFAQRAHDGSVEKFVMDWRDDPRKDQAWYDAYLAKYGRTITAQEVDRDYQASVDGVIIPGVWVQASVDAHVKLGIEPSGLREGGLDVADLGKDKNAFAARHGFLLEHVEQWSGTDSGDLTATTQRAFRIADQLRLTAFCYDADGMGVGVRGPARVLNTERVDKGYRPLKVAPFRGSATGEALFKPDAWVKGEDGRPLDRKNRDYFQNFKAQSYTALRWRFLQTFRAVVKGYRVIKEGDQPARPGELTVDADDLISISSTIPDLRLLTSELSQPVYKDSTNGKQMVDKTPDGMKSPNLSDAVMMAFAPRRRDMSISDNALELI